MAAPIGNEYYKLRSKDGRDCIFKTPEEFAKACNEYFEWIEENPLEEAVVHQRSAKLLAIPKMRAMSLGGLCHFIDISTKTFELYENRKDFIQITTRVRQIIETQQFEGAASGFLNPNIIARKLGLVEKHDHTSGGKEIQGFNYVKPE